MGEAVEHFSYDPVGNRKTDAKTGTNQWSYNQNNELQSFDSTSFKYNLNGQMTEKTVNGIKTYYSYNLDDRLSEIKDNTSQVVAQYHYDPFGRRISKTLPQENKTIFFHYSQEGLIAEYTKSGSLIQSFGYKPNSLYTTNPMFTFRTDFIEENGYAFYINDHLGTPQKLILRNGRTVWGSSSDAFGKTIITNNDFRNPLRFPGQYEDDELDLRYNFWRFYNSEIGRYIGNDPIGLNGGINTYIYAENNPLFYIDQLGQKAWYCSRRLGGKPGKKAPPVANHQYICVDQPNGGPPICKSLTMKNKNQNPLFPSPGRLTRPDEDYYKKNNCTLIDDNKDPTRCYENCVMDKWKQTSNNPPNYAVGPLADDCQEYSRKVNSSCRKKCPDKNAPMPPWVNDPLVNPNNF